VIGGLAGDFLLDPSVTFLNHGSYGALPRAVFDAWQAWQRKMEAQPVAFLNPFRDLRGNLEVVRNRLAVELGTSGDRLALMANSTSALNAVIQSLALQPGDEVLTSDHEYAALEKTWAYVAGHTGAVVKRVSVPLPVVSEAAFTQALIEGLTARTKVLFLSHITSATALVFPLEAVLQAARQHGILSVIDGAHAPGQIGLALDALGADFYAGNCHKWMLAPKGAAFLYARPEVQGLLKPPVVSHGWTAEGQGAFGNPFFTDVLEMQGTRDPTAWLSVPAALDYAASRNWADVRAECRALALATAARVQALTGLPPLASPEFTAPQMVAMSLPECDPAWLHDRLLAEYGIEIPCHQWGGHTLVRLSVQGYNTPEEMDHLVTALGQLLPV
jgi:isopenicillin-N epimerase